MFEMWQSGEVSEDLIKESISLWPQEGKEDTGNYRLVSLTSVTGKVMEQIMLETTSRHEDQESDQEQLAWNYKREIMLPQLGGLNNERTGMVDKGRAVRVVSLHFW